MICVKANVGLKEFPTPESIRGWSTNDELNWADHLSEYVVAKNMWMLA